MTDLEKQLADQLTSTRAALAKAEQERDEARLQRDARANDVRNAKLIHEGDQEQWRTQVRADRARADAAEARASTLEKQIATLTDQLLDARKLLSGREK